MKNQNKTREIYYLISSSASVVLLIAILIISCVYSAKLSGLREYISSHECIPQESTSSTSSQQVNTTPERMYVLGVKDGKLAIYGSDGYSVIDVLDTYVYSLPLSDREAIAKGISVYSVNELISLIEDYTS